MSLDTAPLLRKKQNFAFALETTTGTPATLAAADGVTNVFNPKITFATEAVKREKQGTLSPTKQAQGARSATCEFETELVGSGSSTAPIWVSRLLAMCGLTVATSVWTPTDGNTATGTLGHYIGGSRLRQMSGAMGSFKIAFKRGQAARITWSFTGIQQPNTTATIAPTYTSVVAPLCGTAGFTIGGTYYTVDEVMFDSGNVVILRQDITGVDSAGASTGYRAAYITDREPKITLAAEALPFSTQDWSAIYQASTTMALSLPVGGTTHNMFTFAAPNIQLAKDPEDAERDGLATDALEFLCVRNSAAGQDEYSLTIG